MRRFEDAIHSDDGQEIDMSRVMIMQARRSGKTTAQMQAAPRDSYYVWCNGNLSYPIELAKRLGRADLKIVPPSWLNEQNVRKGVEVELDHATMLDTAGYHALQYLEQRKRSKG